MTVRWPLPREYMARRPLNKERKLFHDKSKVLKFICDNFKGNLYWALYRVTKEVYQHTTASQCKHIRAGETCRHLVHEQAHERAIDRLFADTDFKDAGSTRVLISAKRFAKHFLARNIEHAIVLSGNGLHYYLSFENFDTFFGDSCTDREKHYAVARHIDQKFDLLNDRGPFGRLDQLPRMPGSINVKATMKYNRPVYAISLSYDLLSDGMDACRQLSFVRPKKRFVTYGNRPLDLCELDTEKLEPFIEEFREKKSRIGTSRGEEHYGGDIGMSVPEIVGFYDLPVARLNILSSTKYWNGEEENSTSSNNRKRFLILCWLKTYGIRVTEARRLLEPPDGYMETAQWDKLNNENFERSYDNARPLRYS